MISGRSEASHTLIRGVRSRSWHGLCRSDGTVARPQRLVIVRRGAVELFRELQERFSSDPDTVVLWDRRVTDRRVTDRRRSERRFPDNPTILSERGFLVVRPAWTPGIHPKDGKDSCAGPTP